MDKSVWPDDVGRCEVSRPAAWTYVQQIVCLVVVTAHFEVQVLYCLHVSCLTTITASPRLLLLRAHICHD
jgi:hypothetical protein